MKIEASSKVFKSWPRFANFPENVRDATDAKMVSNKLVSMDMRTANPSFQFNIYIFRALKFDTVIEAKLSKVGPGLPNRKIAFISIDLVLHGLNERKRGRPT